MTTPTVSRVINDSPKVSPQARDAAVALTCDPPLTTVAQPLPEMARLMTELLVARIEGAAGADEHRVVPTTPVRRGSA